MSIGDRTLASVTRGGWRDVTAEIDLGLGADDLSLWPSSGGMFRETPVYDTGLSGQIDVKYWQRELVLDFHQFDQETLEEIYSADVLAQLTTTGVDIALTFMNGLTYTVHMYAVPEAKNDGYGAFVSVGMTFKGTALTSMFMGT